MAQKKSVINLDYPITSEPRFGYEKPVHPQLDEIIAEKRESYRDLLLRFLKYRDYFLRIPIFPDAEALLAPAWVNSFLPALDTVAIYGFLCENNPANYFEVGSGWSTKVAGRAIADQGLRSRIVSIDPEPRVGIDTLCTKIIRQPLEEVDLSMFDELHAGDVLFVDSSHCSFMNSDATVMFLEVLPRLRTGVIVGIHDIFLPCDYPANFVERYYSEQYLLACCLLAGGSKLEVLFPGFYISKDSELREVMSPLWQEPAMEGAECFAVSFWVKINA